MELIVGRHGDCPNSLTGKHSIIEKIGKNKDKADICRHCNQFIADWQPKEGQHLRRKT